MTRRDRLRLFLFGVILAMTTAFGQTSSPAPARVHGASADLLPPDLKNRGDALLAERNDAKRAKLAGALVEDEPERAASFLVAVADEDPSAAVRRGIVGGLGTRPDAAVRQALERHAASDPDPDVALLALERLRRQRVGELRQLLRRRLESARAAGDAAAAERFTAEDERWISLERGSMLPSFLRQVPARFAAAGGRRIHVLAFGDFGNGSVEQKETAAAMRRSHAERPFDFGLTLGDNFYEEGMTSPADARWTGQWEDLYGPLGIRFYPSFGNHDWKLPDSPAAEILYSGRSASWNMPAPYYTFTAGPAQFFAIDTEEMSELQLAWLKAQLEASSARWKIVYGHHPVYSAGHHGDTPELVTRLLPVLRRRADVYLCGHDHDLQRLREDQGVHFFVAGGGGAHTRALTPGPRSLFAKDVHGFAILDADDANLTVRLVGSDSQELDAETVRKPS